MLTTLGAGNLRALLAAKSSGTRNKASALPHTVGTQCKRWLGLVVQRDGQFGVTRNSKKSLSLWSMILQSLSSGQASLPGLGNTPCIKGSLKKEQRIFWGDCLWNPLTCRQLCSRGLFLPRCYCSWNAIWKSIFFTWCDRHSCVPIIFCLNSMYTLT